MLSTPQRLDEASEHWSARLLRVIESESEPAKAIRGLFNRAGSRPSPPGASPGYFLRPSFSIIAKYLTESFFRR